MSNMTSKFATNLYRNMYIKSCLNLSFPNRYFMHTFI